MKGQIKGQVRFLQRLLQKRFGTLSEDVSRQLQAMSCEQREQIAENMLTAASLEELGLNYNAVTSTRDRIVTASACWNVC